ncbi:MAG: 3-hydroxyacyl-ACP dehydratase FabZ family protein [Phycisphaerales bacterium JB050]
MASELIFEIDSVDLGAQQMSRAEIAGYLPHRGPIFMLDRLIWMDDECDHAVAIHNVPTDAWWRDGHIPGMPLMPGVLMVEAGAQLASLMYYKRSRQTCFAGFTRIEDVRFRGQVSPGDDLLLLCKGLKYNPKRFVTMVQGLVNGEIVFDGSITGMIFPKMGSFERTPLGEDSVLTNAGS